jgi:hypothetical protein
MHLLITGNYTEGYIFGIQMKEKPNSGKIGTQMTKKWPKLTFPKSRFKKN